MTLLIDNKILTTLFPTFSTSVKCVVLLFVRNFWAEFLKLITFFSNYRSLKILRSFFIMRASTPLPFNQNLSIISQQMALVKIVYLFVLKDQEPYQHLIVRLQNVVNHQPLMVTSKDQAGQLKIHPPPAAVQQVLQNKR